MARSRLSACDNGSAWSSTPRDFSISSPLLQRAQLLAGQQQGERNRRRRRVEGLAFLDAGIRRSTSSAAWRSWPRSSASGETTAGSVRTTSLSAFLPLESRTSNPLAPPADRPCPLIQDQVEAGVKPVPAHWEGRDAGVAARDLERDGDGGKCFP
jgi:hypothetical protein